MSRENLRRRDPQNVKRGPDHWNWKGGRPWERFKDPRYLEWRTAVLDRDSYTCQLCGRMCKKHEKGLAAHHINEWANAPDRRYDVDNGVTLCRECHMKLHGHALPPGSLVACACGCGVMIAARDRYGRSRRFVNHHARRGAKMSAEAKGKLSAERRGQRLSPQHRARISRGLRLSTKRIGRPRKPTRADAPRSS